jgi:hypothetical protein
MKTKYKHVVFKKAGKYEWCARDSMDDTPLGLIFFSRKERTGTNEWVLGGFTQYRIKIEHLLDLADFMSQLEKPSCNATQIYRLSVPKRKWEKPK